MATTLVSFLDSNETMAQAVAAAQDAANAWLDAHKGWVVRFLDTNSISEINKATGGTNYTYVITLVVEEGR